MRMKALAAVAALLLVAACSSDDASTAAQGSTGVTPVSTTGPVPGTQGDLNQTIGDRVFFDTDQYNLRPDARATVDRWAAWLQQYPNVNITLEGHADERGTREYNLALGDRRANSVRDYLIALGVSGARIATISYGKERPAVPGSSEVSWQQNRRAVAVVN
ncbi:MAG: peptidoglycan-associated lipoprotein Pal [Alphaproteobacteria bacterium]